MQNIVTFSEFVRLSVMSYKLNIADISKSWGENSSALILIDVAVE